MTSERAIGASTPSKATGRSPPPPGRRRLAAVMFADMADYSRHMEEEEELSSAQVVRSVELFKSLIADYGGQVKNVAGDGILALFESAEQALRYAISIQNEFRDQAVWSDGEPVRFRIGLNLGEVTETDGNVQGHCVNVAARLQAMAEPGGILVTSAILDAVRDHSNISLHPLGRQTLKNIAETIEVFAVARSGQPVHGNSENIRAAPAADALRQPSIAVLALDNLSAEPANHHLCEGIVEDIIANLSRFRSVTVIARHSAFLFRRNASPAREIGRRLGVRYLLGGSLRRAGKRMRIAVELVDAESESVIWSDRFDIGMEDVFDLQDEITSAVASRLAIQIDFAESREDVQRPSDMRAYGLVLRGQHLILHYTKEANAHARRLFEEAIEIAPDYGRAYSSMSRTHNLDWRYTWSSDPDASLDAAVELARNAVLRDHLDARGYAALGLANLYKKRHDEALADYARAIALNPNDADILAEYADALVYVEQPTRSIELMEKAMRLNPYYPDWYLWYLADAYNAMGRPADVIATIQRMQNPNEGRRLLAANYAQLGMMDEARAQAREVMRLHPEFTIARWRHRPPYRDQAVLERYIGFLRKAGLPD
ncbi:MAG TPA: tetratricopeptide repeat protein [Alphaproteobacteria bacterium]|nr:tetratricopeptide repeat protein [Alphaproteobacteria bacterium]